MAGQAPAFLFYPKDFSTDGHVLAMTLAERGAYITLLCVAWMEGGLPTEPRQLAQMVGLTPQAFRKIWPALRPCFTEREGRLVQKRLEHERQKLAAYREAQRQKGLASGRMRQTNHGRTGGEPDPQPNGNRGSTGPPTGVQPNGNRHATEHEPKTNRKGNRTATGYPTEHEPDANFSKTKILPAVIR